MTAAIKANSPASGDLYERDVVARAEHQAFLLRAGRFAELAIESISAEMEDISKGERRQLANPMAVLLAHPVKWRHQPERRGSSWQATIRHQRERMSRRLARTPSLEACLADPDWWLDAWGDARMETAEETGIGFDAFPSDCPWTLTEILDPSYWPDGA